MKSVIVFGGSRGIGKNIVIHLLKEKYDVTVSSRDKNKLKDFQEEILKSSNKVNIIESNISEENDVVNVFENHKKIFKRYPELVINATGTQGPLGPSWTVETKEVDLTIKTNLLGSFIITKIAISLMIKNQIEGSIIHFSGGGSCYARSNFNAYAMSKTGLLRLVETVAEELNSTGNNKIIINAIAPGAVKTQMTEEVLKQKNLVGEKAYKEAEETNKTGGTNPEDICKLVDFLSNPQLNKGVSGRLIHFKDNYIEFAGIYKDKKYDDNGKLRRIPLI